MITSLCLNPAIDRTITVARLQPGGTNRIIEEKRSLGGKGINCARMLAAHGLSARVIAILGESDLEYASNSIEAFGGELLGIPVPGAVRENLKILSRETMEITEVNAQGKPVHETALSQALQAAIDSAKDSDWLILTGSIPSGCSVDVYARLINSVRAHAPNCRIAVDAEGEAFRLAALQKPDLVKPNQTEMSIFCGQAISGTQSMFEGAAHLLQHGVRAVLASMGKEGSLFVSEGRSLSAASIPVEVSTTVGAGDAMLSGFIAAQCKGRNVRDSYATALASAAASVSGKANDWEQYMPAAKRLISVIRQ